MRQGLDDAPDERPIPRQRFDAIAATQWVHTPAAMQAAEIVGTVEARGEADSETTLELLDLGCGSAVWSCAIAYRDPHINVTAIDSPAALEAASSTAKSIQLDDRFEVQTGDCLTADLDGSRYDYAMIAQQLHSLLPPQIDQVLARLFDSLKPQGKVVIIDSYRGPQRTTLAESLEMLKLQVQAPGSTIPEIAMAQDRVTKAGFTDLQFAYIAASRLGLGILVGSKP